MKEAMDKTDMMMGKREQKKRGSRLSAGERECGEERERERGLTK
jgi:hypothetical protein